MKKVTMAAPDLKLMGVQVSNYPQGYKWPWEVLVRECVAQAKGEDVEFTIGGYGVLTIQGRGYIFELNKGYAKDKGYPDTLEGEW